MKSTSVLLALVFAARAFATEPVLHDREPLSRSKPDAPPPVTKPLAAPEFDLAAAPGALALLAGSIAIYSARRTQKRSARRDGADREI
jgi:hypothetical protein